MPGKERKSRNARVVRGGVPFYLTMRQIRNWMAVPVKQKLWWLEEANRFNAKVIRGRTLKILDAFRAGEI